MFGPTARQYHRIVRLTFKATVVGLLCWGVSALEIQPLTEFEARHLWGGTWALLIFHIGVHAVFVADLQASENDRKVARVLSETRGAGLYALVVAAAALEEILFRGAALRLLAFLVGTPLAVVGSAFLDAWAHKRPQVLAFDISTAIFFGLCALQYGLGWAILVHAGFNFFVMFFQKVLDSTSEAV